MTTAVLTARLELHLTQAALAEAVGLSRQAVQAIEAGRSSPGVDVALRLAAALGQSVEHLFGRGAESERVVARVAGTAGTGRVGLGRVNGRWIAHPLSPRDQGAADGVIRRRRGARAEIEPLAGRARAEQQLLVMGCAPALGVLAARLGDEVPLRWVQGASNEALRALARHDVHIAGIHHETEAQSAAAVRRVLPSTPVVRVTLAGWELGLATAPRNPRRIHKVEDLARPGVKVVVREGGSGARSLLLASLSKAGIPFERLETTPHVAHGHLEVAELISAGLADVGVTIGSAALAFGLPFLPLVEERFDLVIPRRLSADPRVERLVDRLASRPFRTELDSLGGYRTQETGHSR